VLIGLTNELIRLTAVLIRLTVVLMRLKVAIRHLSPTRTREMGISDICSLADNLITRTFIEIGKENHLDQLLNDLKTVCRRSVRCDRNFNTWEGKSILPVKAESESCEPVKIFFF